MEGLQNNKRLRTELQAWLSDIKAQIDSWNEVQEAERVVENGDSDDTEQAEYAHDESQHCAGLVIHHLQRGSRPWATVHRTDVADSVSSLLFNTRPPADPTAEEVIQAVSDGLDELLKPCRVRIEMGRRGFADVTAGKPDSGLRLLHRAYSESQLGVTLLRRAESAEIVVEGRVTERARFAFARSIRAIDRLGPVVPDSHLGPLRRGFSSSFGRM